MKMMKQMAGAALAAAIAAGIAGCGGSNDYSAPKVSDGAVAAIVARPAENTSLAPLCKQYGLDVAALIQKVSDKDFQEAVKELALDKAQIKWIAVTFDALTADKVKKGDPDFAVAIATSVDLDQVVAFSEKKSKEKGKKEDGFKKTTIAGVPAYEVVSGKKADVCLANLDKQLILVAKSSAALEKQIALYRDGKGASADFGSFSIGGNDIIRVKLVKTGENVKKALPSPDALKMVNAFLPDGDKIIAGLGGVDIALAASGDGKSAKLDLSVETAADADADKLVTLAKTGLMGYTAQMKEAAAKDADAKLAYDTLKDAKLEAKGKVATFTASTAADPALKAIADKVKEIK